MTIYKNEYIDLINLNESHVTSISWIGESNVDLELLIDWCGQDNLKNDFDFDNISTKITFNFCYNIDFNFKYRNPYTIGTIEITTFSWSKKTIGDYDIQFTFDYQPVGYIRFSCSEFRFTIESH